jgi:hypothetical protein
LPQPPALPTQFLPSLVLPQQPWLLLVWPGVEGRGASPCTLQAHCALWGTRIPARGLLCSICLTNSYSFFKAQLIKLETHMPIQRCPGGQARQRLKQKDHGFGASLGYIARPCLSQAKGGEWVSELHGHPMARRTSCGRRSSSRVCCQGRTSRICSVRHYCVFRVEWRHVRTRASPSP